MFLEDSGGIFMCEVKKVLTDERQQHILNKLKKEHTVKMQELMNEMNCSESTVRRDLSQLEEQGLLVRVHGGAKRVYTMSSEPEMKEKSFKNIQKKKEIAQFAANLVEEGDILFLDAGTTTYEMIPYLEGIHDLLIVTNGVTHAHLLTDYGISTILIGGQVKGKTKAVIGSFAQQQLNGYRFSKAFLGMNGIDEEFGYTTPDVEEAAIKKLAGNQANQRFVLADHSKFHKVSFSKVGELEDYILITDKLEMNEREQYNKWTKVWEAKK